MNDMRVLGSHNSYKLHIDPALKSMMEEQQPGSVYGLEYGHPSLTKQLDLGLRKLELDVVYDPEGGHFATPFGYTRLKAMGLPVSDYDPDEVMKRPGFKVLHAPDVDFRSNCLTFRMCLREVKAWSKANPTHLPIAIMMNAKDGGIDREGFVRPLPFDSAAFDAWDQEIRDVFARDHMLLPDDVRGDYATLEEAVLDRGWPLLSSARGKVYFILDHGGTKLETYIKYHPSLKGRVMFVNAPAGTPEAAFMVINDPVRDQERIKDMVAKGYLVRTRTDANTKEARENDYTRFEAAKSSGAQILSTDFYLPDSLFGTGFHIIFPEND
ncbi:MAG: phosphatidylinositol-specific phospholipase C1-like protein [Bacteroidota bacterium]